VLEDLFEDENIKNGDINADRYPKPECERGLGLIYGITGVFYECYASWGALKLIFF
jgi:hypothetical protein